MSTAQHCDLPGCDTWQRGDHPGGWVHVIEHEAGTIGGTSTHYCRREHAVAALGGVWPIAAEAAA